VFIIPLNPCHLTLSYVKSPTFNVVRTICNNIPAKYLHSAILENNYDLETLGWGMGAGMNQVMWRCLEHHPRRSCEAFKKSATKLYAST
jgi:hypothetical protein